MQALKTIVITLGVVLVAGFGLLVYGLSQNWHRAIDAPAPSRASLPSVAPPSATPPSTTPWGPVTLGAANERIAGVTASGDLLVVQMTDGQTSRLLVLDPRSGRVVGSFVTGAAP